MQSKNEFSFTKRDLAAAIGYQLDSYGDEVGIKRGLGESDYSFRNKVNTLVSGQPIFNGEAKETMASDATLRDYFAAKATKEDISDVRSDYYKANGWSPDREPLTNAQCRYMHADLMLAERAK